LDVLLIGASDIMGGFPRLCNETSAYENDECASERVVC